jgi:hypothetical protein
MHTPEKKYEFKWKVSIDSEFDIVLLESEK